jgi:hypothetical protein
MSIAVQRATEITRQHTGEQTRPDVQHSQFADRISRAAQQMEQQVVQTHRSEGQTVNPDGRGQGGGAKKQKKEDKSEKKSGGKSSLDVLI